MAITYEWLCKNYSMAQVESLYRQGLVRQEDYEAYGQEWERGRSERIPEAPTREAPVTETREERDHAL